MGFAAFSRRQRRLALTALLALAFTALAMVVVALAANREPAYR
jgi:hypothetical protein